MIKLVAYTTEVKNGKVLIRDSEGEEILSNDFDELVEFLNEPFPEYLCIKVFWDLDTGVTPILRLLDVDALKELASPEHEYDGIFYIPGKLMRISKDKNLSFFYHLSQYYPEEPEPNDPDVICGMAHDIMDGFKAMGLNPKKLTSPVAIYEAEVLNHMKLPVLADAVGGQEEIIDYAERCLGLPDHLHFWIEAYQIGNFDVGDIYEYDIRSSFPSFACKLRNIENAIIVSSRYYQPEADWGFMKGVVTIYDHVNVSPIFNLDGQQPTGTFPAYITKQEYEFIKKWNIGEFEHEFGYYIHFTSPICPMEATLKRVFNQRGFGTITDMLSKRISTAVGFGKMLQKYDNGNVGELYNPLYACMVVTMNNLKVAEFIYKNDLQDDVVNIQVDSVTSTKEAEYIGDQERIGMGDWRFSGIGAMLVLSSGRVYHGDKKPQGLNYDQMVELITANPKETYYTMNLKRRQTLEESIQLNDLKGLGKLKDTLSSFNISLLKSNTDRIFSELPENGYELLNNQYKSKPVKVGD